MQRGKFKTYLRYAIWLAVLHTANANRRHFGLTTTWLPHLLGNTAALLLPEIYQLVFKKLGFDHFFGVAKNPTVSALQQSFEQLAPDNPDYLDYVAPVALAYIVSHPRFNIYRGKWGELNVLGFGLDSIPHCTTAYALSNLVYDTVETVAANAALDMPLQRPTKSLAAHKHLVTAGILASLTLIYETSEYLIHKSELRARNNDISRINMMWSVKDTVFDVLSNGIGWALAAWRRLS